MKRLMSVGCYKELRLLLGQVMLHVLPLGLVPLAKEKGMFIWVYPAG
jgi:hypothetical protein